MFTIENGNRYLAQWDTGQRLIIDDREITEVHFAKGTNVAAVMQVTTEGDRRVVKVPNICLQLPNDLAVFFVITTPDGRSNTVHFSTIRVVRRPRPDDYVETEDEVLRWTTLASTIGSLTDLQTVEKTNLVAAINEVLKKVDTGGSIDPATIAQAVEDYLSENPVQEKDPTVPAWAKETEKPSYTAQEVGADPSGTAAGLVAAHNTAEAAHNDIRLLISGLTNRLNALADSDDTTLDQLSEVVAYIKANRELITSITTDKVSVTDIIDNLTTNVSNKPLSAAQGVALKALIDAITIPEKMPNPNALTFTGAATGSYDGSKPLTVNVPSLTVDDSLTKPGQAADAAKVGQELSSLSGKIDTTSESKVSAHNTGTDTHSDIRLLIQGLTDRLNALADSDDTTLDQLSEVVAYIKSNRTLIESITTSKVSVSDIIDNLTTNASNKPLSAAQGVALKALIDAISVPDALPNPNALTFTGAVEGSYDGSAPLEVEIPSSGAGSGGDRNWKLIRTINIVSGTASYSFNTDNNGNAFKIKNFLILIDSYPTNGYLEIKPNGNFSFYQTPTGKQSYPFSFMMKRLIDVRYILETSNTSMSMFERKISNEYSAFGEFTSFVFWFSVNPSSDTIMYILGEDV